MGEFKFGTEDSDSPIPETFVLNGLLLNNKASIMCLGQKELIPLYELFPILRPLSDLTKKIEIDGETFRPFHKLDHDFELQNNTYLCLILHGARIINLFDHPYEIMQKLFEWHFDVFGLIDKGLAIDINTL